MGNQERSLAETPTWFVATVTTGMVAVCFIVERLIYRFGMWLRKTKRKALLAALEKIKEELMLLGFISLMLGQCARWISEICVDSSLFSSKFYPCARGDFEGLNLLINNFHLEQQMDHSAEGVDSMPSKYCSEGHEPFVSYESLKQLLRFLFVLGITHVLYSCFTIVLAMIKIYSWRKWEIQASLVPRANVQARRNVVIKRQSTFVFHHTSHPWSKHRVLIWMNHKLPLTYDFHKYMVRSMEDEFHGIVGIGWPLWGYAIVCIFVNVHGLNIYLWLSFIPAILILVVGTKLQHVVACLALEIVETTGPLTGNQLKPRDELFWFGKPELLLWLIQFISFQNSFEMATFIWSLWGIKAQTCFMKNSSMVFIRLISGLLVQFWCSYSTLPLNVIITQMGSRFKKALIAESVRQSLHGWCKRVKERSRHDLQSQLTRSTCSLESIVDGREEIITVASGCLSRCPPTATQRSISQRTFSTGSVEHDPGVDTKEPLCDFLVNFSISSSSSENGYPLELDLDLDDHEHDVAGDVDGESTLHCHQPLENV
ncbi:MLO-like protein 4 isoform X2 [Amborella trichopoda]|uniref:MLO-like protein 4 isoform X2 n=1 Tax=Amborella trichopoda TaxID=13333 RepID=UPI0009C006A1|nr:MLO-like protein 4 isoform X2 [Amborella trichopoda]|eukprot:XP_020532158.1 MLO-like protein 4 isoform X2 [Amborella trichopoda]